MCQQTNKYCTMYFKVTNSKGHEFYETKIDCCSVHSTSVEMSRVYSGIKKTLNKLKYKF